jgi:hypothetical protein
MHRIQMHHQRLCGHYQKVAEIPLAVYQHPAHDEPRLITASEIELV